MFFAEIASLQVFRKSESWLFLPEYYDMFFDLESAVFKSSFPPSSDPSSPMIIEAYFERLCFLIFQYNCNWVVGSHCMYWSFSAQMRHTVKKWFLVKRKPCPLQRKRSLNKYERAGNAGVFEIFSFPEWLTVPKSSGAQQKNPLVSRLAGRPKNKKAVLPKNST